ncbi:MAG TPA: ISKra4 family transposase [Firmicutes bacterium]|nr:ISKra4 family transposase [Bacillota bacterium]
MYTDTIVSQNAKKIEGILRKFVEQADTKRKNSELNVDSVEGLMEEAISAITKIVLDIGGAVLAEVEPENDKKAYCPTCGRKMIKSKADSLIKILSIFGHIPIYRDYMHCRACGKGYGIIDEQIGIDTDHRMTKGMIDLLAYVGQLLGSFDEAKKTIERLFKFLDLNISHKSIQVVSEEVGKKVYEKDMAEAEYLYEHQDKAIEDIPNDKKEEGILYISMDGSALNTRDEDQTGQTWREVKVGLVFRDRDIMKAGKEKSKIQRKRYVAYVGEAQGFKKFLWAAAVKEGYGKIEKVVIIGDGAQWIWNIACELFPDADAEILDYYHLSENVNGFAELLYPEDEVSRKRWVDEMLEHIYEGRIDEAIRKAEGRMPKGGLPKGVVNLAHYLSVNRERMRYKEFECKGYYIGSGSIESGHKVVIQKRMKQPGMRWSLKGAQYIASLRAKYKSDLWDEVTRCIAA